MIQRVRLRELQPLVQVLLAGALLSRVAFSMTTPFLTIFLIRSGHLSLSVVGLVVGGASVAGMVGGLIAGALTDRYGRNKILLSAVYGWVAVFSLFAASTDTWVLVLMTLCNGLCRSIYEPVSQVLLSDMTPPDRRYQIFSTRYTAANIGYSIGPLIGAWLGLTGGRGAFVFTAATFLVYAVLLHTVLVTKGNSSLRHAAVTLHKQTDASFRTILRVIATDKSLLYFLLGGMMARSAYEQVNTNLSVHFQQHVPHGLELFALTVSLNAIVVVVFQVPLSRWGQKRSLMTSIVAGNACYAAGLVILAFTRSWVMGILGIVIFTFGEILTFPAGTLFIDKIAPEDMRGAYYGTKNVLDLGKFFGPWLGSLAMNAWGGTTMLTMTAGVVLLSTSLYRLGVTRQRVSPSSTATSAATDSTAG